MSSPLTHPFDQAVNTLKPRHCKACAEAKRQSLAGYPIDLVQTPGGALICPVCDIPKALIETVTG